MSFSRSAAHAVPVAEVFRSEVLVRFMRTQVLRDPRLAARAGCFLDTAERLNCARLRPPAARRDYLGAHVLARLMIAELSGCDPRRVQIVSTPLGQPQIVAPASASRFSVSISHADGIALCGIAEDCEVGVDVESLQAVGPDPMAAVEAACTHREVRALRALPASARAEHFLALWTRKEALAKAHGIGLACVAGTMASDAGGAWRPPAPIGEESVVDPQAGRLETLRLTPDHVAAVAVLGASQDSIGIRLQEVRADLPEA